MLRLSVVSEIVPDLYADWALRSSRPSTSDVSRSNLDAELTLDFWHALNRRGYPTRRELHESEAGRYYLIAHTAIGFEPTPDDLVTDLSPWRIEMPGRRTGPLHGSRSEVMAILGEAGLPEDYVALRGLDTLRSAHTLQRGFPAPLPRIG